ncbi:MAG TPA: alpha/beta fold hydrolase [Stellaceae bacterium]|nr:alpha/beta fold hydrolase [Stellaceae bacterium]
MRRGGVAAFGGGAWLGGLVLLAAVLAGTPARAESQVFSLYDFPFEDGTILPELRIAYETHGTLSAARDNAIVLLHDTINDHHAFDALTGPGKLFDTDKYFVIAADAIGGGESSSPTDGKGQDFPRYTIRDMMTAEYGLVSKGLGLTQVRAIVGRSMGAFIALEWAVQHPEMPRSVVLLAPSARSEANYQVVIDLMISTVALDPEWEGGRYAHNPVEGLRRAGMIYYPWAVSADYLNGIAPRRLAQESGATANSFADWDANALVLRYAACRGHDVTAPFANDMRAALARATMPVLLLPSASDRLIGASAARRLRDALPHPTYAEIPTELGHRAIAAIPDTPEGNFIDHAIRAFLATVK